MERREGKERSLDDRAATPAILYVGQTLAGELMARHTWQDWEVSETLRIARLPRQQWPREIETLTQAIRGRTDPKMDEGRVGVAVQAADNLIAGRDWGPSERLRVLYEQEKKQGSARTASGATVVRRRQLAQGATLPSSAWSPTQQDRARLLAFEGYGVDAPDIVFVGLEEYCDPDPTLQHENIRRRCTTLAYNGARVDKNDALNALEGLVKTTVPVWDMMAKIMASLTGTPWETEREALGSRPPRHRPTTLLTELRALPRPGTGFEWQGSYLANWFPAEFAGKQDFERKSEDISGQRVLRMLEQETSPTIVFFYGEPARGWASDHLGPILRTEFDGDRCSMAQTKNGTLLVSTGFYNGQHAATAFRERHIPELSQRIRSVIGESLRRLVVAPSP
jgi:hypothetical protein